MIVGVFPAKAADHDPRRVTGLTLDTLHESGVILAFAAKPMVNDCTPDVGSAGGGCLTARQEVAGDDGAVAWCCLNRRKAALG
jgi:hypothetical protein